MQTLLRLLLKNHHPQNRSTSAQTEKGMTLVELLVGAIMAFLIITPMLGFVVDMLNTDRREQVKTNTEQDVQAALDFIAQDLSQAIHIYDNAEITTIKNNNFLPSAPNETPILVFWKRKQIKNAVDPNQAAPRTPRVCDSNTPQNSPNLCNDTYVRSLVAYYLVAQTTPNPPTWCQPSGNDCPSRIKRYEISEGVKDSRIPPVNANGYFSDAEVKDSQTHSPAFNSNFDWKTPTVNVTTPAGLAGLGSEVLVNYIDHSPLIPPPPIDECQRALGNPTAPVPGTTGTAPVLETTLKVTDSASQTTTNSFYACVDTSKNIARVTIRGNSLRRFQPTYADYDAKKSAFFPTASVQVQGLGARGN